MDRSRGRLVRPLPLPRAPAGFMPLVVPITEPALGYGAVAGAVFFDPREEAGPRGGPGRTSRSSGGCGPRTGARACSPPIRACGATGICRRWSGEGGIWARARAARHRRVGGARGRSARLPAGRGRDRGRSPQPARRVQILAGAAASPTPGRRRTSRAGEAASPASIPATTTSRSPGRPLTLRYDSLDNMFTPTRGLLSDPAFRLRRCLRGPPGLPALPAGADPALAARRELLPRGARAAECEFRRHAVLCAPVHPAARRAGPALPGGAGGVGRARAALAVPHQISLLGFGGAGLAWTSSRSSTASRAPSAQGLGARYLISRKFGLHMGLDVAHGPEDGAIYVQFGNAWMRP